MTQNVKSKKIRRIKENIAYKEYKKLMDSVRGSETLRSNTKKNYLRTFCILYYTGLRLNEVQEIRVHNILELLEEETTKIIIPKTNSERKLHLTKAFKKELLKLFDLKEDPFNKIITKGSVKNNRTGINNIVYISKINAYIKEILGKGYTSHSFRQGLITEMGSKGINIKMISSYIGHVDVKTTMRYIKPTDEDIKSILIR